jgi:hypothetical protein
MIALRGKRTVADQGSPEVGSYEGDRKWGRRSLQETTPQAQVILQHQQQKLRSTDSPVFRNLKDLVDSSRQFCRALVDIASLRFALCKLGGHSNGILQQQKVFMSLTN